jgi:tripartite-type tricarboxylate transporter receptor subunit TctC
MMFRIRHFSIAAALTIALTLPALAQDTYPSRPVRIVVGAAAGGVTDVIARFFGEYVSKQTGGQIVVENVTGAGGNVAFAQVATSNPDGYTLGLAAAGNIVINPALYKNMRFDPIADLVPVAPIAAAPQVVVVQRDVPAKSFADLLNLAKAKPGTINYGSAGAGTTNHIAGALLAKQAGVDLVHVPYRGIAPAVTDLVGGRIQLMSVAVAPVIGFVREGSMRPLAVATKERLKDLPEVPTAAEAGLPGYEMTTWFGLMAPKGTPKPIVDRLNALARAMVADPTERKRLEDNFLVPMSMTPEEFTALVKADAATWSKTVSDLGIQLN